MYILMNTKTIYKMRVAQKNNKAVHAFKMLITSHVLLKQST